jgi:hypothetical protein
MRKTNAALTHQQAIAKIAADPKHRQIWERAKDEKVEA